MATNEQATPAADIVAIYLAETMEQVMTTCRPMSAAIYETADLMEHPLEDGSVVADHLVLNPTEVEFPMVIQSEDIPATVDEVRQLHVDGELLTVQTRSGSIFNMVITGLPRDERPEAVNAPNMLLRLRQARFVTPEYGSLQQSQTRTPRQSSTVARGQQQARPAAATRNNSNAQAANTEQRGSTLYRIFKGRGS